MKSHASLWLVPLLLLVAALPEARPQAIAGAPPKIDYQGTVLDSSGNPLAAAAPINYTIVFRIYDAQTGPTLLWTEQQIVTVSNGLFSVRLGEGTQYGSEPIPNLS